MQDIQTIYLTESIAYHSGIEVNENLYESIGGMKDRLKEFIGRRRVNKFKTRFLQAGRHRVYLVASGNDYALVELKDQTVVREEMLDGQKEANQEISIYKEDGYIEMNRPSKLRSFAAFFLGINGLIGVAYGAITLVALGVIAVNLAIAGEVIVLASVPIAASLVLVMSAFSWWTVKISKEQFDRAKDDPEKIKAMSESTITESAPPSNEAEKWIEDNKERFKKQYGDEWENVIYATAWKMYNDGSFS